MNIITLKPEDYVPSYITEKNKEKKIKEEKRYEEVNVVKIVLKDENYVPEYQKILNDINNNVDIPIIHFTLKTEEETNTMPRKKKAKIEKEVEKQENGKKKFKNKTINLNFSCGDRIIFRPYSGNNDRLNAYIMGDLSESFIKEDIEREPNNFVKERDYEITPFLPTAIKNGVEMRFSRTYIDEKCVVIFDVYGEEFNKKRRSLVFEVVPLELFNGPC